MGLRLKYATKEEVPEHLRDFYVELNGAWALSLEDADDIPKLKGALEKEKNDRKAIAEKAAAEATARAELAQKLKLYEQFGDPESLQKTLEEVKKAQPPPKLEEVLEQLKVTTAKLRENESWRKEKEPHYAEIERELNKLKLDADHNNAKAAIQEIVGKIQGVNRDALADTLYYRYLAGELKRSDAGEIVTGDDQPLSDFAQNYAKERGFILPNVPSGGKPPSSPNGDSSTALMAQYKEAEKNGDLDKMLELKSKMPPNNE